MPEIDVTISHEVEVYCAKCGAGLCNDTEYTQGRTRFVDQFRVDPCYKCMEEKDREIQDLEEQVKELEEYKWKYEDLYK